jgi:hypothetical protein
MDGNISPIRNYRRHIISVLISKGYLKRDPVEKIIKPVKKKEETTNERDEANTEGLPAL